MQKLDPVIESGSRSSGMEALFMIFIEGECKLLNTRVNVRRTTQRNSHLPASDTTHRSMGGFSLQPLLMSFKML